jgi:hypothetical protein
MLDRWEPDSRMKRSASARVDRATAFANAANDRRERRQNASNGPGNAQGLTNLECRNRRVEGTDPKPEEDEQPVLRPAAGSSSHEAKCDREQRPRRDDRERDVLIRRPSRRPRFTPIAAHDWR